MTFQGSMLRPTTNNGQRNKGLTLLLCCSLFVVQLRCGAQNLVPNPSFEQTDTCAEQEGFLPNGIPLYWYSASETPDYLESCVPDTADNYVPDNPDFGYQAPYDGGAYSGMWSYLIEDHREMIGVELIQPLAIGQTYYASFHISTACGGGQLPNLACNGLGLLFSTVPHVWTWGDPSIVPVNYAQIFSSAIVNDTVNWALVSGSFLADSSYQYLIIGNHFDNAHTDTTSIGSGTSRKAYYLVDQVCVSALAEGCDLTTGIGDGLQRENEVWPNPASNWVHIRTERRDAKSLVVRNVLGEIIWKQEIASEDGVDLNVQSWTKGYYVLEVLGNGSVHSSQFVLAE